MGYDVFLGNPHTNEMDPGFKLPVIDLTYDTVCFDLFHFNNVTFLSKSKIGVVHSIWLERQHSVLYYGKGFKGYSPG